MGKKHSNSAQCAWLFGHAHLTGEASIEIQDRVQIYFSTLSLALAAVATSFFARPVVFLTAFVAGLGAAVFLVVFFTTRFGFIAACSCCFTRSSRNNSSWLGLSISMQGSA